MPGLYRSPAMADIDVCFGKREAGAEALKRVSQRYREEDAAVEELLYRPRRSVTLPPREAFQDEEGHNGDGWGGEATGGGDDSRDAETSDGSMHEGYGERRAEQTGLPPTPPGAPNSVEPPEPLPLFADGVRNALSSQKSGALSTTPVNPQLSPPTPDNTPPAHRQDAEVPRDMDYPDQEMMETQTEATSGPPRNLRGDARQTVREDLPVRESETGGQVFLPENDTLPAHWLDDKHDMPDMSGAVDDNLLDTIGRPAFGWTNEMDRTISPTPPRHRYRFESPRVERQETDWEKHISYVSGPDELDVVDPHGSFPAVSEDKMEPLAGLGVSGAEMQERQRSAEDINNDVYKQIQQENIRRESAISTNSGAIRAGILLPSAESTPRSIRRRAKCGSLRNGPDSEGKRNSDDGAAHALKHERRQLPSRKALQESPTFVPKPRESDTSPLTTRDLRQVSSPARLGPGASGEATRTLVRKLALSGEQGLGMDTSNRLKRQSHGERLSKNMSVRRTSQEVSPSDLEEAFNRIDRGAASVRKQKIPAQQRTKVQSIQTTDVRTPPPQRQSQMNQGVKRSKPPNYDVQAPPRLRKVIPSVTSEPDSPSSPRQVRRFSREERLENNEQLRHSSTGQSGDLDGALSHESAARRTSQDPSIISSPRKSTDARNLHPSTTPMSISAFSDRTADIEVGEASGVRIYPHNNNSLLVVQQGSRPVSKDKQTPDGPTLADLIPSAEPIFSAQVDPPTPVLGTSIPEAHVHSPLTNPRAAPQPPDPPSIQFIPPTPSEELEQQLGDGFQGDGTLTGQVNLPGRNLSFKQKVRRYSDSFFGRSTGFHKQQPLQSPPRDTHLSPMWRPQRFWDDYDSDDDYYDDYEPEADILPAGGDTSHVDDGEETAKRRPIFPRAMSKRLPGFRGKGGFLQGNSLGIDRHGTNSRRHYVSTDTPTLSKRASEEMLQNVSADSTKRLSRSRSQESTDRSARSKSFKVPFTGGMRAKWVGTQAFRQKMREVRSARQERERERRREHLKGRIGPRVYHG